MDTKKREANKARLKAKAALRKAKVKRKTTRNIQGAR